MSFSVSLIFKKLYLLFPVPSHPSHLVTPKSEFPHALQHGGFPNAFVRVVGSLRGAGVGQPSRASALGAGGVPTN